MRAVTVPPRSSAEVAASIPMQPLAPRSADPTSWAADPTSWRDLLVGTLLAGPLRVVCSGRPASGCHPEATLSTWWRDQRGWQCYGGRSWGVNRHLQRYRVPVHGGYRRNTETLKIEIGVHAVCDRCGLDLQLSADKWHPMLARFTAAGRTSASLHALTRLVG